jgi:hypothetical protein
MNRQMNKSSRRASSFHELAGMSQVRFSLFCLLFCLFFLFSLSFLWIPGIRARPPLSPSFHPHSWLSDFRSVHSGRSQSSKCCYLIIDLGSRLSMEVGRGVSRSHLISAVELGCSDTISPLSSYALGFFCMLFFFLTAFPNFPQRNFDPRSPSNDDRQLGHRAHRFLAIAQWFVTPLRSPTTDTVVPPTFWPPQQQLVSWHCVSQFLMAVRTGLLVPFACSETNELGKIQRLRRLSVRQRFI